MTVHAIVIKRTDSGESDRRLTLMTAEAGKIVVVAKGARKAASRLAGISDPLSSAVMDIAVGRRNSFVTQAQPLSSYRGLRHDYERLSFALSLTELYAAVIPSEQPQEEAFSLLQTSLKALETHAKPLVALVWAQVALLTMEGFMPQFTRCVVSDVPIDSDSPYLSPRAGGFVCNEVAATLVDRYRVRIEVLYGLDRLPELAAPPPNLRFVEETFLALQPFWRHVAEMALPANDAVAGEITHAVSILR